MTNVKCMHDERAYKIDIEGHAGYNPGLDIVCSAASVLGYTLANALMDIEADKKNIQISENGEVHIFIVPIKQRSEEVRIIINTIMMGYELIADQYPENISLEW